MQPCEQVLLACPSLLTDDWVPWESITLPGLRALHVMMDACGMSTEQRMQLMDTPGLLNSLLYNDSGQGTHEEWVTLGRDQLASANLSRC